MEREILHVHLLLYHLVLPGFALFNFGGESLRIGISSLNVWQNSPVKSSGPGLSFLERLITNSIFLLVIYKLVQLFYFFDPVLVDFVALEIRLFHLGYPTCWHKISHGTHNPFYFCRITSNVPIFISAFIKFRRHFFPLVHLAIGLSILLIHSTTFINFIFCFSILHFISARTFVISFFVLTLNLVCSFFTGS